MIVTSFFAALLTLMYVALAVRVIVQRGRHRVPVGDSGIDELTVAVRAHANFNEYVPLLLIMMLFLELMGVASVYLYLYGGVVVLGRLLHAFVFRSPRTTVSLIRVVAMVCTFIPLIAASLYFVTRFVFSP